MDDKYTPPKKDKFKKSFCPSKILIKAIIIVDKNMIKKKKYNFRFEIFRTLTLGENANHSIKIMIQKKNDTQLFTIFIFPKLKKLELEI